MTKFYPVTVADVRRETRDAIILTLDVPDEHKEAFRFAFGTIAVFFRNIHHWLHPYCCRESLYQSICLEPFH